jgi:hypothetical protein
MYITVSPSLIANMPFVSGSGKSIMDFDWLIKTSHLYAGHLSDVIWCINSHSQMPGIFLMLFGV